jgi:preprotein translocase subunit SecD
MISDRGRFNIYFVLLFVALLAGNGCQTSRDSKDKQASTLHLHLEIVPEAMDFSTEISVFRAQPIKLFVDKAPFLTEVDVASAEVVDDRGGFAVQVQFDRHGTWLLEEYSTANMGKHLAIYSAFGEKSDQSRWIAAPLITHRISNGVLTFTPDASRVEADRLVLGLNNVAKKAQKLKAQW